MKITNPITLDVARSNSYICLLGKQFDSNSRYLQVTLTNNGQPLPIPSGAGVVLRATRADGAGSMTAGTVNGDGTALVEIDETVLEVAGAASLSIEVTSSGQVLTSASCNLTVQKADASGWVKVYVAAASVSAGTYYISLAGQSYSFTTTQAIPAGGSIYFASEGGTAQTRDASGNVLDASLTLTAGTSGTELTSDVPTMTFLAALAQQVGQLADTDNAVVGSAEALLGGGTAENVAVALRGNAGNAREKIGKLIGGTIAWNQISIVPYGQTVSGVTFARDADKKTSTINGLAGATVYKQFNDMAPTVIGHVYFVNLDTTNPDIRLFNDGGGIDTFGNQCTIGKATAAKTFYYRLNSGANFNLEITPQIVDLTVALGPTIADYVYTLESGTAGAGVAWLARYFPKILGGYYAYAAPALLSVNVEGKKISGFNIWDEEWEQGAYDNTTGNPTTDASRVRSKLLIPTIPGATYYVHGARISWIEFDAAQNYIRAGYSGSFIGPDERFTLSSDAHYIEFFTTAAYGGTYKHDICLNLSNPLLNGKYFPHREFYYPIQSGELRGVPKLDANNNLTFDGDWQEPDGTRTRRYGAVDLGTLNWTAQSAGSQYSYYSDIIPDIKKPATNSDTCNAITALYLITVADSFAARGDLRFAISTSGRVNINDNRYTTAAAFKTAMSGVYLVYELATPTTETGQPFLAVERLDNGIEEVVDAGVEAGTRDVVVPVGQDATIYRDLAALLGAIPNPPTSAGTYTLRATVTTTNATFSWS